MYSNEDGSIEDVLAGYLNYVKAKHPYHEIDQNNPQATFEATSGVKARKSLRDKVNNDIVNLSTLPMSDSNDENNTNVIGDVDEIDDLSEDLEENTSVYRKGSVDL